jgi:eukaryotic-like serine/threonine-protein kinase
MEKPDERDVAEAERVRLVLRRMTKLALWIWASLTLLDLFMATVLFPAAPTWRFLLMRLFGEAVIFFVYRFTCRPTVSLRALNIAQNAAMLAVSSFVTLMALDFGGLRSAYVHGVSLVMLNRAVLSAAPWRTALRFLLPNALTFPALMGVAAVFSPITRAQWSDAPTLLGFVSQYVFVLASGVVGAAASHAVWAAQRQVYQARKLGRYRLEVQIGAGGMGEVWLAWDDVLRRKVALKVLRTGSVQDEACLQRFEREAWAASKLGDPHTIRIFDFGASDDGIYFIAMEYLRGADLNALVQDHGPLPAGRVLRFAVQACQSIAEAHDAGIIHRDIKPHNLFVTRAGDDDELVKLLDFGIARMVLTGEDHVRTQTGVIRGTPAYMAPELWMGQEADVRSDIYALGATLYFLLSGASPFESPNPWRMVLAHISYAPEPPSVGRGVPLPEGLDDVVLRCLAKDPRERFQTVRDLSTALAKLSEAAPWTSEDVRRFWLIERAEKLAGTGAAAGTQTSPLATTAPGC